jgi:hypothetical protein
MSEQAATDRSTLVTPFNVIAGIIVIIGLVLTAIRFTKGLGATTNLSDYNPWGSGSGSTCWWAWRWPPAAMSHPPLSIFLE